MIETAPVMTEATAGLDYRQTGRFTVPDRPDDPAQGPQVELHLIDATDATDLGDAGDAEQETGPPAPSEVTPRQHQAALVAQRARSPSPPGEIRQSRRQAPDSALPSTPRPVGTFSGVRPLSEFQLAGLTP